MPRKKKTQEKQADMEAAAEKPAKAGKQAEKAQEAAAETPVKKPAAKPPAKGSAFKTIAIAVLLVVALALAYYFLNQSSAAFVPGTSVDQATFLNTFDNASNVYIVMDVRGVKDTGVSNNILQCGVDFAGSSGMGGKAVTPISLSSDGCVAPDGKRDPQDCFSLLKNGITIYVKEGASGASYYSNGMVVGIGANYTLGGCSITRQ